MTRTRDRLLFIFVIYSILVSASSFYCLFIYRSAGTSFFLNKVFSSPADNILKNNYYRDFVEDYTYLNGKIDRENVVVFIGDSITERFNTGEYFPDKKIVNRSIKFDTTLGLLNRLDSNCNNLDVNKIFIMIGNNDLDFRTDSEVIENYRRILRRIQAKHIYIQSILPVQQGLTEYNKRIVNINMRLRELAVENNSYFIDLHSRFVNNDGYMNPKYSRDGVHPSHSGYLIWKKMIQKYL